MAARAPDGFDTSAAITRSLLGWGVVAGPFYLITGVIQGLLRDGFDFSRHQLSLMMHGQFGWIQVANLIITGAMVGAATLGIRRAMTGLRSATTTAVLVGVFALGLIGSGIVPPDPMAGFPPGVEPGPGTIAGLLHIVFGMIQFVALAVACFTAAPWLGSNGHPATRRYSIISGVIILVGFVGGAALSLFPIGVLALWIAVVASFAWLIVISVQLWRATPHPDRHRREDQ